MRLTTLATMMLAVAMVAAGTWAVFKLIEPGSLVQLLGQTYLCAVVSISARGRVV